MSKCIECAKLQITCCEDFRSEIGVTRGDIRRILEYTGRNDFYHLMPVLEENKTILENPCNIVKGSEKYVRYFFDDQGRRNVLKKNEKNGCCFLSPDGCSLPLNTRPIMCRLYPYHWDDYGNIEITGLGCPKSLFKDEQEMRAELCLPEIEAKKLIAVFYDEIMNQF
jgi:hypothetical protein